MDDFVVKKGWSRFLLEDKKSFEEEWEVLVFEEFKFYFRKSCIIYDVIVKMVEVF